MAAPLSSLETFTHHHRELIWSRRRHVYVGIAAIALGITVCLVVNFLLSQHILTLPPHFGMHGNIAAAVVAGALVTTIALSSVLIHYRCTIPKKERGVNQETLVKALGNFISTLISGGEKPDKETRREIYWKLLKILEGYGDEQWQAL